MERLKNMKECLTAQVQAQMGNLQNVDAKELGEAVDMIKDLSEAIYYCAITKAMEGDNSYYREPYYHYPEDEGRMYYSQGGRNNGSSLSNGSASGGMHNNSNYSEREMPLMIHDEREGRSPKRRRMYMEAKQSNQDQIIKMKELEKYLQDLSTDITEMIEDATPEEKQLLANKITMLASKINA